MLIECPHCHGMHEINPASLLGKGKPKTMTEAAIEARKANASVLRGKRPKKIVVSKYIVATEETIEVEVLVDAEDYPFLSRFPWSYSNGYVVTNRPPEEVQEDGGPRKISMHRLLAHPLYADEHVHHVNGNTLDNRKKNLKVMTASEHMKLHKGKRAQLQADLTPTRPFDPNGPEVEVLHLPEPKPRKRKGARCEECSGYPACKDTGLPPKPCHAFTPAPQEIQVEPAPARPWAKVIIEPEGPGRIERLPDLNYTGETSVFNGVTRYEHIDGEGRKRWTITPPRPGKTGKKGPC